ncbi:OsmC family protein [Solirubrobacter phytolaccae]|uniref:OsmC family protein n=1 Tax=Solirubrobacter phytolaccae TaxID=1404360 RepID=A0A9X3S9X4_9ACTN|nr:OsmC family protein [Solirubrobacter phytolaccae]MDA0183859.1 OsmC family protein [Solirubrobacter phytolaccae]
MAQMISTIRNGVDTQQLFATIDAIREQPALGAFTFRATNRWINGAHNRSRMQGFYGAGREDDSRREAFVVDSGEPTVLLGTDTGPSAIEYLLHAVVACLTTTIAYCAAARKIRLTEIESTIEADMDVRGCFGVDDDVRNGTSQIRVTVRVAGDASADRLRTLVERAQERSAVLDMITNGVALTVESVTE